MADKNPKKLDGLTAEQAALLLKADQKNLLEKIKKGGVLTGPQFARLYAIAEESPELANLTHAKNQTELARLLGVDRKTIQRWRKEEGFPDPRSDGAYAIEAVQEWVGSNAKKSADERPGKVDAQIDQLLLQNRKLSVQIGILEDEYIHRDEVVAGVQLMVRNAKRVLLALPDALAPQVIGTESLAKIGLVIREQITEALTELSGGKWE